MRTMVVLVCWNLLILPSPFQAHWISMKCGIVVFLFYLFFSFLSSLFHSFLVSAPSPVFFSFLAVHRGYSFWTSLILRVLEHVWSAALIHHSLKAESTSSGVVKLQIQREKKICKGNKEEIPNPVSVYKQLYAQELDWLAIPSYEDHGKLLQLKQQFFFSMQNLTSEHYFHIQREER